MVFWSNVYAHAYRPLGILFTETSLLSQVLHVKMSAHNLDKH